MRSHLLSSILALPSLVAAQNYYDPNTPLALPVFNKNSANFTIGGLFSLSSSGTVNAKGIHRAEAFKCAIARANADSTLLPGMTLYWNLADDGDDPINSVSKTMSLMNKGIMAVVGASASANTDADSKVLSSFNIPLVTYASSSASLSDITRYPTLLRTVASDVFQTKAMVSLALHFDWTLVGAIGTDDTYGGPGHAFFVEDAEQNGVRVACNQVVPFGTTAGIQNFASCLKSSAVKVVMIFTNEANAATIIAGLYKQDAIPKDMIFIASDSWSTSTTASLLKAANVDPSVLAGTISTIQYPGDLTEFKECLGSLSPASNDYPQFIQFWESRFMCSTNPDFAGPVCDDNFAPSSVKTVNCKCNGKETLANDSPNNKAGLVDDAVYAVLNAMHVLIHNCKALPVSLQSTCSSPVISSSDILNAIRALKFTGVSGEVAFEGVDRTSVSYDYIQYNGTKWNTVGQWTSSGQVEGAAALITVTMPSAEQLTWRTGYAQAPISAIIPDIIARSDPIAAIVKAIAGIGMVTTISLAVYFLRARDHAVIKRASPLFCVLMLFGMLLIYIDLFLWDGQQSAGSCSAKIWIPLIGFGFVMGPMLAKTFRIYKIFSSTRLKANRLQDAQLLGMSAVVITFELVLLMIWTIVDPIKPKVVASGSDRLYTILACEGKQPDFQKVMNAFFVGYNCLLLVLGVVMSYKTRNVHSSFNESKYIAYAIYNIALCFAVLLPIYATIGYGRGSALRGFIVRSLATLFGNTACMLILFGPKLYQVYRDASAEEYESSGAGGTGGDGTGGTDTPKGTMSPNGQRRGSHQPMFSPTSGRARTGSAQQGRRASEEKGGKSDKKEGDRKPTVKVLKTVKTTIPEDEESSKGGDKSTKGNADGNV